MAVEVDTTRMVSSQDTGYSEIPQCNGVPVMNSAHNLLAGTPARSTYSDLIPPWQGSLDHDRDHPCPVNASSSAPPSREYPGNQLSTELPSSDFMDQSIDSNDSP